MRRADNVTTFICRLSSNLGASASWNPQGLSRPVMGLLYLFTFCLSRVVLVLRLSIWEVPGLSRPWLSCLSRLNVVEIFLILSLDELHGSDSFQAGRENTSLSPLHRVIFWRHINFSFDFTQQAHV